MMKSNRSSCGRHALLVVAAVTLIVGCGDDGRRKTYPVSGKVVYPDGSPLPGGTILCVSDSAEGASLSARANINTDGTFVLGTYEEDDGAVAGRHVVAFIPPTPSNYNPDAGPPPRMLHPRFESHDSSGVEFNVTEDGPNDIVLEVSKR